MIRRVLRFPLLSRTIGRVFAKLSFILPVARLCETDTLLAFHHPKPSYPFHVLIVPKKAIQKLEELDTTDSAFLTELFSTVKNLVKEFNLPAYRLIVNGGEFQDFPQLHFHLISDTGADGHPHPRD